MPRKISKTMQKAKSKVLSLVENPVEDVVKAIREDHDALRRFIEVLKDEEKSASEKTKAYTQFAALLESHALSEQTAVYAPCREVEELEDFAEEGFVEHAIATGLMRNIAKTKASSRRLAEMKVLAELVEHHIEEEESDFLPQLSKYFSDESQDEMTKDFLSLRSQTQKNVSRENAGVLAEV